MEKVAEGELVKDRVIISEQNAIAELYDERYFGKVIEGRLYLSLIEALLLVERGWISVMEKGKEIGFDELLERAKEFDEDVVTEYIVYRDLRNRGYIVKTGYKFGADFRVYDKGAKLGENHSKFLVKVLREECKVKLNELSASIRVAHTVKKRLVIGVVDSEGDVTYYKFTRVKP